MNIRQPTKLNLGFLPTPITKLSNLSNALNGPEILIKRDDLTGLALGGNKTRKLEFILQEAINNDCDTIITAGAIQSNHCRQTAAAAAYLNMECHLVLGGSAPKTPEGNLLLNNLLGASIHWAGKNRKGEDIPNIFERLKSEGKKPFVVPYGGSNELGAYAFSYAVEELTNQFDTSKITHVVFASASGGTHAGLMLGKALSNQDFKVVGISIDKVSSPAKPFEDVIIDLANQTSRYINANLNFSKNDLILNGNYVGEGYGVIGDLERNAISLMARHEGILLDPVYTGRAMGGLIDMIKNGEFAKSDKVLFWHTGGAPALFSYSSELAE